MKYHHAGARTQLSNHGPLNSNSVKSLESRPSVADYGLRKVLNDPSISENDRLEQVRLRTDQIEKKA